MELVGRIAAGDEEALRSLYMAYHWQVHKLALTHLSDPHEAAEVVNEVMFAVWCGADRFQGDSTVRTWLLGIARNKIMDRYRQRSRRQILESDEDADDPIDEGADAQSLLEMVENAEHVRHCLNRLSHNHREVMHLTFFQDLSCAEIAAVVGIPEGTVKTRMFHARKALKRCLSRFYR